MNQSKLKYARERLNVLVAEAISAARPESENLLTYLDAANMLVSGEKKIPWDKYPYNDTGRYQLREFVEEHFDSWIKKENDAREKRNQELRKNFKLVENEIKAHKVEVEDELVLGDEAKALELLAAFSANY